MFNFSNDIKKLGIILESAVLCLLSCIPVYAKENITQKNTITINGKIIEAKENKISIPAGSDSFELTSYSKYSTKETEKENIKFIIGSNIVQIGNKIITIEEAPFIDNGTTMLPLRAVYNTLSNFNKNLNLSWDSASKSVIVSIDNKEIIFKSDTKNYMVNTEVKTMVGTAPKIKDSRIYLPLRVLSEELNFIVLWNNDTKTITITP